jgi:hypothetical protein
MKWGAREPDPGSSAEAQPHDRRVWSGGSGGSVLGILIYLDWGMHLNLGMDMVIEPSAQPPFGGDLVS